jgi:tetratricopeptide (TPR) repeat protein
MNNLAHIHNSMGRTGEAKALYEQTWKLMKAKLGEDHPTTLTCLNNLAAACEVTKEAIPLYEDALRMRKATVGADHPDTLMSMANLATAYVDDGQAPAGIALFEEALRVARPKLGNSHSDTIWMIGGLADAYAVENRGDDVELLINESLAVQRQTLAPDSTELAVALVDAGRLLLRASRFRPAEKLFRECLEMRQRSAPEAWSTANVRSLVGAALAGQNNAAEAEPFLRQGYEGLVKTSESIPVRSRSSISDAASRLADVYKALDRPDDCIKFQIETEHWKCVGQAGAGGHDEKALNPDFRPCNRDPLDHCRERRLVIDGRP